MSTQPSGTQPASVKRSTFREFGLLADDLQPPAGVVRCQLSSARIAAQFASGAFVVALGLALAAAFFWFLPSPVNWLGGAAAVGGFAAWCYLATHKDYAWIELDGNVLRAKGMYTGRVIERPVAQIARLVSIVHHQGYVETAVIDALFGRVKGMEIQFRDGRTPIPVHRSLPAMTNAEQLLHGVLYRMNETREIEPEVVQQDGKPLVRSIHWHGEPPHPKSNNSAMVTVGVFIGAGLMMGGVFGFWALQEQSIRDATALPPHELTLAALIQNGPGENRHVTITDFRAEGYVSQSDSKAGNTWNFVWVALFPPGGPDNEIKAVLSSQKIPGEAALRQLLQQPKINGVCSKTLDTSWGTELGPEMVKANGGIPLKAAWNIQMVGERPSAEWVQGLKNGGSISFLATLVLAAIVFWRRGM